MTAKLGMVLLSVWLAARSQPAPTPLPPPPPVPAPPVEEPPLATEFPAFRCLKLELNAPAVVRSEADVLVTTVTNSCNVALEANIAGSGPGFILENSAGEPLWRQPGGAFLATLTVVPFRANEVKTYQNPWTPDDHTAERVVAPGRYTLYSQLSVQRYRDVRDSFVDLESSPQPLTYEVAATP